MRINVTFRHIDGEPTESLKQYVEQRLKKLKKYADGPIDINVVLSKEKYRCSAEVVVSVDGLRAAAKEVQGDLNSAIDLVSDKIEKQLRKFREKLRSRKTSGSNKVVKEPVFDIEEHPEEIKIITERIEAKPMSVEEAIAQFELLSQEFFVFTNAEQNAVNVIYRRKDGTLGLIEPENP